MEIIGTLDSYTHYIQGWQENKKLVFGLFMANYALIQALLKYGSFDEFHFYLRNQSELKDFENFCDGLGLPTEKRARLKPQYLLGQAKVPPPRYTAFHHADPRIYQACYFRENFFSANPFPVTGMVHTISGKAVYDGMLKVVLAPSREDDALICPSQALKTALSKYLDYIARALDPGRRFRYRGDFVVIPLGIDTNRFTPRDKRQVRQQLGLPLDAVLITYIGRLSPINKMELVPLLHAFREVLARAGEQPVFLLIVGQEQLGGYVATLQDLAKKLGLLERMIFVKDFPQDQVPLYYSAADIFVSPSDNIQETFGLTPIEAMSSGVPAVISDWNGYQEAVIHGVNGFKVPTCWSRCHSELESRDPVLQTGLPIIFDLAQSVCLDIPKMAEYLIKLVTDRELREKMGQQGRADVLKKYDWQVVIPQLEKLWRRLAPRKFRWPRLGLQRPAFLHIPYFDLFRHYATRLLADDSRVRISPLGQRVLEHRELFHTYSLMKPSSDPELIETVLGRAADWVTIEQLLGAAVRPGESDPEKGRRQIMFMLKYGLLLVAEK